MALLVPQEVGVEPSESPLYLQATQALQRETTAHGLPFSQDSVWVSATESHEEQGFQGAMALLANADTRPDALIVADDLMTRGALRALAQRGLQPGRDVQIVSHANRGSDVLRGLESELSLIEFDPAAVVQAMFEALEALMAGESPPPEIWIKPQSLIKEFDHSLT